LNTQRRNGLAFLITCATVVALASCGGGSSDDTTAYTLAGTVSGLSTSGLVLANGSSTQAVASGATSFTFSDSMTGSYSVSVATQPDGQTCVVSNGSGSGGSNVSSVVITCRGYVAFTSNWYSGSLGEFTVGSTGALAAQSPATLSTNTYLPSSISTSADGKFAYVSFQNNKAIGVYSISASTGALSLVGTGSADSAGYGLAISPDSKYLYAANYGSATVSQFTIGSTGALTAMSTPSVAAGVNPYAVAVSPDGLYVYVVNASGNSVSQYSIGSTGALTALSPATVSLSSVGTTPLSIAIAPDSNYLYVTLSDSAKLAQFSIGSTGLLTALSPASVSTGTSPSGIVVSPGGRYAYVANSGDNSVSQYSISSGKLTAMATPTVAAGTGPSGIAVSPSGSFVYAANYNDATVTSFSVGSSGALTSLGTASTNGSGPSGISVR
jgi:DNA-binding beta-propeller fold protein YncE